MPYAFFYDVPGTEDLYQRVKAEIGDEPPKGLVLHLVARHDGMLRHFNVWDSKEVGSVTAPSGSAPPSARCWPPPGSPNAPRSRPSGASTWSTSGPAPEQPTPGVSD
jgi:hypothetical protein